MFPLPAQKLNSSWDTYTGTFIVMLSRMLESVQTFALRLATKCWAASGEQLRQSLSVPTLAARRRQEKLCLCQHILRGESVIPPLMFILVAHPNPYTQHSCPLVVPFARTNTFQSTFFIDCCWQNGYNGIQNKKRQIT